MKLVVTSPLFPPAFLGGGPIRTIAAMLDQADARHHVALLSNNYDLGQKEKLVFPGNTWVTAGRTKVMYTNRDAIAWAQALRSAMKIRPDAYYLNGLFNPRFSVAMQLITRTGSGTPVALAPRGELNPGALSLKSGKKTAFLNLVRGTGLLNKVIWHASSEQEKEHIYRWFGDQSRVIVREDDTSLPKVAEKPAPSSHERLRAVFISRLSPIKGLDVALDALSRVRKHVDFDVIGPEEDKDYVAACRRIADRLPSHIRVRFLGAVPPERARDVMARYDVMVLPTGGENFGHVIGEALSVSLPVILTDTTPWSARIRGGGGVLLGDRNAVQWAEAIDAYASMGPEQWKLRRFLAATSYNEWQSNNHQDHFFDLLELELCL